MANFTAEQLAMFREHFDRYDTDGNGSIAGEELGPLMESLGHSTSERQMNAFLNSVDIDRNGSVEFDEFVALIAKKMKSDRVLKYFQALDKNGDGYLSAEELSSAMAASGQNASGDSLARYMAKADKNGDGRVNYEEFAFVMGL